MASDDASPYDDSSAWLVNFGNGSVDSPNRNNALTVRLTRASQ